MMDMAVWQEYLKLLDNLGNTLEKLTEIERSKTAAVSGGNLHGVEECMKQEQVISLSLRGMDQKREKMLAQLGLTGVPLRELEARGPRETHMETRRRCAGSMMYSGPLPRWPGIRWSAICTPSSRSRRPRTRPLWRISPGRRTSGPESSGNLRI